MMASEQVRTICSTRCKAFCCRGPNQIALDSSEVTRLGRLAAAKHLAFEPTPNVLHDGWFMDVPATGCVFLTDDNLCSIYDDRPNRCRTFPLVANTPNCELSGWVKPPQIFVGVPRSGERMNLEFQSCFMNMQSYLRGTHMWGGCFEAIGATVEDNQNDIVDRFLRSETGYLMLIEDDMLFKANAPSMLVWKMRKAQQQGIDMRILGGLYFQRLADEPLPHFYRRNGIREHRGERALQHESMIDEVEALLQELPTPTDNGPYVLGPEHASVMEVDAATTGFLAVERSVFEEVPYPWFRRMGADVGEPGYTAVDFAFFYRAHMCGIASYGDVGIGAGHLHQGPIGIKMFKDWQAKRTGGQHATTNH